MTSGTAGHRRSVSLTTASMYSSLVAREHLRAQARELLGVAQQALERPCQRGRGGPVGQQRDQFVAHLLVAHRRAALVVRLLEHREDALVPRAGPARRGAGAPPRAAPLPPARSPRGSGRCGPASASRTRPAASAGAGSLSQLVRRSSSTRRRSSCSPSVVAEDRAHHHLVADRLHPRPQLERLANRPAGDLRARHIDHHLAVAAHPLAVERRAGCAAVGHVRRARPAASPSAGPAAVPAAGWLRPRRRARSSGSMVSTCRRARGYSETPTGVRGARAV